MEPASERRYGFGLSRDAHIAFAAAYIAVLLTVGGFGVVRFLPQLAAFHPRLPQMAQQQAALADRAKPLPDPAFPHQITLYPRIALLNRQQGVVTLRLLVLSNGQVGDVNVVKSSGYPQLDAAALIGTGYWRYLPAVRNGEPVSSEIDVSIRFKLTGS